MNICFIGSLYICVVFGGDERVVNGSGLMAPTIDRQSEHFPKDLTRRKQVLMRKNPPQGGDYFLSCTSESGYMSLIIYRR